MDGLMFQGEKDKNNKNNNRGLQGCGFQDKFH